MGLRVQEITPWDGSAALLIDGGSGPAERPPVHLQAAAGGYLRLVSPDGPVLWGLVDDGYYGVDIVRSQHAALHVLPPILAEETRHAPRVAGSREFLGWWTRHYATLLCASSATPLAQGRRYLLAPSETVSAGVRGMGELRLELRWQQHLAELVEQRDDFALRWDIGSIGLLLTRPLSEESDGRVKAWRKIARERRLPPVVTWLCRGLYAHVLLDGHDRVHAALLEGIRPDVIVLADAMDTSKQELEARKNDALEQATSLERMQLPTGRAIAMNMVLRSDWDPRAEWELGTPGFPLEGGAERWYSEVRGTSLEHE